MKRILALILSTTLCFLLVSCNKSEVSTDAEENNTSVTEVTDASNTENAGSETMSEEEILRSLKINVPIVKDYKIDIPDKTIDYIEYSHDMVIATQAPTYYESEQGDVFIFRRKEKIEEIVSFFENATLEDRVSMPTGKSAESYKFFFTDGTWVTFSMHRDAIFGSYLDASGEYVYWFYRFLEYADIDTVICK